MTALYSRLAVTGIKKNSRTYLPYMLTCVGMVMMCYVIHYLSRCSIVENGFCGPYVQMILDFGKGVMAVFSLIFLTYTHSFLIKSRKMEFGLYNILGMNKRNIAVIMLWETLIICVIALVVGLSTGVLFSKLAELGAEKILELAPDENFRISWQAVLSCAELFAVIFGLIYLRAVVSIGKTDPGELLKSSNTGEVPPKSKFFTAALGVVILGAAYYIAVTTDNPVAAMMLMFFAVIMVIIATYILFTAGSSALCAALKKNKKYYYKTNHFVSVSQMNFRMKRNGAGLASICILSTMVLVTVSATTCLYIGEEEAVNSNMSTDFAININASGDNAEEYIQSLKAHITDELNSRGLAALDTAEFIDYGAEGNFSEGRLDLAAIDEYANSLVNIIPLRDYNTFTGENVILEKDELLINDPSGKSADLTDLTVSGPGGAVTFKIKGSAESFDRGSASTASVSDMTKLVLITADEETAEQLKALGVYTDAPDTDRTERSHASRTFCISFNTDAGYEEQMDIYLSLHDRVTADMDKDENYPYTIISSKADQRNFIFSLNGSLFFLGIVLGTVFIFAAALIMYYKQSSEGFEDRRRYEILQKVGMTVDEIRSTVNSQVLTVFFLPLAAAGVHLGFAFPILSQCLKLLMLTDTALLGKVTLMTYGAFAVFYIIVYLLTSKRYFAEVSAKSIK